VVSDDTHAAGGVATADWLVVTFGSGDFSAIGTGARTSDVDDGLFPGLECRDNSASPSSYLHTLPDDDDDVTTLFSPHSTAPGGSAPGDSCGREDFDGVNRRVTHARLHVHSQSENDDDGPADTRTIKELLGPMSQHEDAACVDDGVDVRAGGGVDTGIGVGVSLGVGLRVILVMTFSRLTSFDS